LGPFGKVMAYSKKSTRTMQVKVPNTTKTGPIGLQLIEKHIKVPFRNVPLRMRTLLTDLYGEG